MSCNKKEYLDESGRILGHARTKVDQIKDQFCINLTPTEAISFSQKSKTQNYCYGNYFSH